MRVGYRIVERFTPWHDSWASYAKGHGLSHLTEVVGLDCSLCPPVQKEYSGQDDGHLVFEKYISACFRDLEYALSRTQGIFDARYHQVLALAREPTEEDVVTTNLPGYRFKGYELIEDEGFYSALTNCGGFEGAFVPTDLSECGLVSTATRAYEIRRKLVSLYPDDDHANCAVWAVWRWEANQQAATADRPSSFL